MKVKISKGNETLNIDDCCLQAWEKAGWKKKTEEKPVENKK